MANAQDTSGGRRKETAAWAVGAAAASLITGWAGAVQIIQEPLERDLASMHRRLDEAILASSEARNVLRDQIVEATKDNLVRSDERLGAVTQRLTQANVNISATLNELATRVGRIEQDRMKVLVDMGPRLARIENHLEAVDARLVEIEKVFTRVMRGNGMYPNGNRQSR